MERNCLVAFASEHPLCGGSGRRAFARAGTMFSLGIATVLSATAFSRTVTQPLVLSARARRAHAVPQCTIAVFGASGRTGSEVALQALERGEKVSCLVRDRTRLKPPRDHPGMGLKKGSMLNFNPSTNDMMFRTEGSALNRADVRGSLTAPRCLLLHPRRIEWGSR